MKLFSFLVMLFGLSITGIGAYLTFANDSIVAHPLALFGALILFLGAIADELGDVG